MPVHGLRLQEILSVSAEIFHTGQLPWPEFLYSSFIFKFCHDYAVISKKEGREIQCFSYLKSLVAFPFRLSSSSVRENKVLELI